MLISCWSHAKNSGICQQTVRVSRLTSSQSPTLEYPDFLMNANTTGGKSCGPHKHAQCCPSLHGTALQLLIMYALMCQIWLERPLFLMPTHASSCLT